MFKNKFNFKRLESGNLPLLKYHPIRDGNIYTDQNIFDFNSNLTFKSKKF